MDSHHKGVMSQFSRPIEMSFGYFIPFCVPNQSEIYIFTHLADSSWFVLILNDSTILNDLSWEVYSTVLKCFLSVEDSLKDWEVKLPIHRFPPTWEMCCHCLVHKPNVYIQIYTQNQPLGLSQGCLLLWIIYKDHHLYMGSFPSTGPLCPLRCLFWVDAAERTRDLLSLKRFANNDGEGFSQSSRDFWRFFVYGKWSISSLSKV